MTRRSYCCLLSIVLLGGCETGSEPVMPIERPSFTVGSCTIDPNRQSLSEFARRWGCNAVVRVNTTSEGGSLTTPMTNAVITAVASWNSVFNQPDMPVLTRIGPLNQPLFTVNYNLTSGGTYYCGKWETGIKTITIRSTPSPTVCPLGGGFNIVTDLTGLVKHEMSHAVGFLQHLNEISGPPTATCLASVPEGFFNESLCQHEIQAVWYMYGIRNTDPDLWHPMQNPSVSLSPSSATILTGASQTFNASVYVDGSVTPTLTWLGPLPAIASYTSTSDASATVQAGQSEGQTQVTVQINEDPTFIWPPSTGSATLNIQKPPVASITIAPSSATLSGVQDETFYATVIDESGATRTDVTLTWTVDNTVVWSWSGAQWLMVSSKHNGTIQITATAPNGVQASVTVTVTGCPVHCAA